MNKTCWQTTAGTLWKLMFVTPKEEQHGLADWQSKKRMKFQSIFKK